MSSSFRSTGDLLVVLAWTAFALAALLSGLPPGRLRTVIALPLVVLFPGYALLAFLYPERPGATAGTEGDVGTGITSVERLALSVVTSLAIVPMIAFVINYSSYSLRLRPLAVAVGAVTIGLTVFAFASRLGQPTERRYHVPAFAWLGGVASDFLSRGRRDLRDAPPLKPTTGTQRFLNLIFVVSLLALVATAGYAAVTPPANDEPFTEFYLVTQDDEGQYTAENLPSDFSQGEGQQLAVAIGNHEGQEVPYTVVVQLEGEEIDRFSTSVRAGRTKYVTRSVTPTSSGDQLKLSFLLYRGDVPGSPSSENAYRETNLRISVSG